MAHVTFVHGIGNKPEPRALLDLWRRKFAQGAGAIGLGDAGVESSMVYWADVLYERPDPDLAAFESGAGVGVAKSPEGHRWGSFSKARFAPDSPLGQAGFEPLVPPVKGASFETTLVDLRSLPSANISEILVGGTGSSNPVCPSGEPVSRSNPLPQVKNAGLPVRVSPPRAMTVFLHRQIAHAFLAVEWGRACARND
jgi:hypothetical protein